MPFPIASPPVAISDPLCACDVVGCQGFFAAFNGKLKGDWTFNGAKYATAQRSGAFNQVQFRNHLVVLKSTDDGATWIVQDEIDSPLAGNASNANADVQFDEANGFLHIVYSTPNPGSHLFYVRFDLNAGTWGAPVDSGIALGSPAAISSCASALQSDGVMVEFFVNSIDASLYRVTITNQAWGAPAVVVATFGGDIYGACVDGADTAYVAYRTSAFTGVSIISVDSGGAAGAPVEINAGVVPSQCKQIFISAGKLIIPYCTGGVGPTGQRASFYETVSLVDFTATSHDLHDGLPTPSTAEDHYIRAVTLNGIVYFFWVQSFSDTPNSIFSIYSATYDGTTIGTPRLVWDQLTLPVACAAGLPQDSYFLQGLSVVADPVAGTIGFITFAEVNQDEQEGLVYFSSAVPPPPTIDCGSPPPGVVGSPY